MAQDKRIRELDLLATSADDDIIIVSDTSEPTDATRTKVQTKQNFLKEVYTYITGLISSYFTKAEADARYIQQSAPANDLTGGDLTNLRNQSGVNTGDQVIPDALADLSEDSTHRVVTDAEKANWNAKQSALGFTPENSANKGQALGYAELDAGGKVPLANLPSTLLVYKGVWNATTNTPTLSTPDTSKKGWVYNVSVAGNQFGIDWKLGDWAIYNDSGVIEKSDNSDDVVSVNGKQGVVILNPDDLDDTSTTKKFTSTAEKTAWNAKQNALGFTPENVANKEDTTLDTSTTKYPTNRLVKQELDKKVDESTAIAYSIAL